MTDLSAPRGSTELALMTGIEDNRAAVEALAELLTTTMEHGGSELPHLGMGVCVLFRFVTDHADRNMEMARDLLRDSKNAGQPEARAVRRELLEESLDAGQIGQAANVEPDAVQRVIAQLLAMSAPAISGKKAVAK